jgi:hypothetical protein
MIAQMGTCAMSELVEPGQPRDNQVMLVIRFQSGPDSYVRVPPHIAEAPATQSMMELVRQRQACGELPPGEVAQIIPVH